MAGPPRPDPRPCSVPSREDLLASLRTRREALARIVAGDPLRIGPACRRRLAERQPGLDPGRVLARALARAAHGAPGFRRGQALAAWIGERVDEAIDDLLEERAAGAAAEQGRGGLISSEEERP